MNKEQAKGVVKHYECVKALADGKVIQLYAGSSRPGKWIDCTESNLPNFFESLEYRVKPEPREIEVFFHCEQGGEVRLVEDMSEVARKWYESSPEWTGPLKFRQVI